MKISKRIVKLTKSLIVILSSLILMQGCATMNESECLIADWNQLGFRDGSRGLETSMMDSRARACQKHNINVDRESYLIGHSEGLETFCVAFNGYQHGSEKIEYKYVCPIELEEPYLREYIKGLNVALDQVNSDRRNVDYEIREAHLHLREATTVEQRNSIDNHIRRLESYRDNFDSEDLEIREWLNKAIYRL